jgi:hypothetical protein
MQSKPTKTSSKRKDRGNTILEFALLASFLIPMLVGAFTIGMAMTKSIQVSNVTRDAVVLMVSATTDPKSGLDLSQTQNQRIIVRAAQGLGMNLDAQYNPNPSGNGVVVLSKVILVGATECSVGIVPAPHGAPPWSASNCPNYGSYVFAYRVVIGNGSRWSSVLGNPGGTVQSNGTITAVDIASNTSDRVSNFTGATGMTLTASNFALLSEMYADISVLNFFSTLTNPTLYSRSIS